MSSAFADARFLLSAPPRTATVRSRADAWRSLLERAGVETVAALPADVLVADAGVGYEETRGAPSVIIEGTAQLPGYRSRRYVVFGSRDNPTLFVPGDRGNVVAYALSAWSAPRTTARRLRSRLVGRAPQLALRLARWPELTVATRDPGPPYVVAAALQHLAVNASVDWLLICGHPDDLARAAFLLFPQSAAQPRWVVKFMRVPSYAGPIERDQRALAAVAAAGGAAASHAPRFLGRFEVSGLAASIETAAGGRPLSAVLHSAGSRVAKMRLVDAVAGWIVELGRETRHAGADAELERLRVNVLGAWPEAPDHLLAGLSALPAVLQHNDLGTWNIVTAGEPDFTAVDWESANPSGLPLWDLWYFLASALPLLEGEDARDVRGFALLFRGEAAGSSALFRWTRSAVEALGIPPDAVGKLATLCWLHHGLSHGMRSTAVDRFARGGGTVTPSVADYAHVWLSDPALGSDWRRWIDG